MTPDWGRLRIDRVIVHEVPRARASQAANAPLTLSQIESPLPENVRTYLQERLRPVLTAGARDVVENPTAGSPVPAAVRGYLQGSPTTFVAMSQQLARHLRASQTGVNPGGLLMAVDCELVGESALSIVKLEHERGVRAQTTTVSGKPTYDVTYLKDLLFGSKTRVFKVGVFTGAAAAEDLLAGAVVDKQLTGTAVAEFFLHKFLGCRLAEDAPVTTERFFVQTQDFINSHVEDPAQKSRYEVALLAEMQSARNQLSVTVFADDYLEPEERDNFVSHMTSNGVPPATFDKSVVLIEGQLASVSIDFARRVKVIAPRDTLEDGTVTLDNTEDGRTRLQVIDEVRSVKGRASPGRRRSQPGDHTRASDGS